MNYYTKNFPKIYILLFAIVLLTAVLTYAYLQHRPETPPPGAFYYNAQTHEFVFPEGGGK